MKIPNITPPGFKSLHKAALPAAFAAVFLGGLLIGRLHWLPADQLRAGEQTDAAQTEKPAAAAPYQLTTERQSYFKLDEDGALELKEKLPFRSEGVYRLERTIRPGTTAVIVMDPWTDMASDHLNDYYAPIASTRIVPLVRRAIERGHPVIVLTNDPAVVEYNTKVDPELAAMIERREAELLYHQDLDDDAFAEHLRSKGIDSLIYTGFASNMCVIGRQMGMIPMIHHGFCLYFVPQASAAVEYADTWENQSIHRATTKIISQWIAEIVDYDEFMQTEVAD